MKVCLTLICFFFLSLQDGNTGVISAEIPVVTGQEGGNITHACSFYFSGKKKIFCKEECEEKDILIKTEEDRAQSGRYSIEYEEGTFPVSSTVLYVSITNLTKSDSGRYRCSLNRFLRPDSQMDFELRFEDAPTNLKPIWTLRPLSTSVPSASTPTTTKESLTSSPGSWTPLSSSLETTNKSEQQQTTKAAASDMLLPVGLTLGILIIVLLTAVLIFCRKRNRKLKEPPVETENVNVKKANRVYEEIRQEEDRQSRSPPVEISTVYSLAKYTKPHAAETSDDYSLATAVSFQQKSEDASNELIYSQVDFSNGAATNSAPCGYADNVIYSVPRVKGGSDTKDASPPLYSTVTLHQS